MIVHLNGWPGVGKQTIGRLVAATLGARFIHNHLLHDVAIVCAGFQHPDRWPLYEEVRRAAYGALARHPPGEVFVMTNALLEASRRGQEAWAHVVDLAMARASALVPVVLDADPDELCRRVESPERAGRKLADARQLRELLAARTLQRPDVAELIELDVTRLSAIEAAGEVVGRLRMLCDSGSLRPATREHLRLR